MHPQDLTLCLIVTSSLLATDLRADLALQHLSHQRHLNPGERAAVLGGAYTALSNDPSGIYYNPAGTTYANQKEVSLNVLFSRLQSNIAFKAAVRGHDFREQSRTEFAGLTGGLIRWGILTLGYGLLMLDNKNINQNDSFSNLSTEAGGLRRFDRIHQESNVYNLAGAGASLQLSQSLAIGLSLFQYTRRIEWMDFQLAQFNGNQLSMITTKVKTINTGILPILGMIYRGSSFSLGMSVRKGISISDSTSLDSQTTAFRPDANNGLPQVDSDSITTDFFAERNPMTLACGLAWHPAHFFTLALDGLLHQGVPQDGEKIGLEDTANFSIGMELDTSLARLGVGAFTNNTMYAEPRVGATTHTSHVDYLGRTAGLTVKRQDVEGTVGYVVQTGKGTSRIIQNSSETQDVVAKSELIFVSAKYNF